jgi:ligand-binding sensor domain-containing protein/signal transduction histidine kinase
MRVILLLFFIITASVPFYGQTVDLRFSDFKLNEELSSHQVSNVVQDKWGFIWFGTNNGLFRFDGYEMKKYLSPEGLNFKINENSVYGLHVDKKSNIWVGLNSMLCRYDYPSDSIKVVVNVQRTKGMSSGYVTKILDRSDSVLLFMESNAIYQYNEKADTFISVFRLPHGAITAFNFDKNENLWIASNEHKGIYHFNTKTKEYYQLEVPEHINPDGLYADLVERNGYLWVATSNHGVFNYNLTSQSFKKYPVNNEYELNTRGFYIDRDNFLWLIDFTALKLYVEDRDFFQGFYPDNSDEYSITPYIYTIFQDRDHNYWTTHYPGGIGFAPQPKEIARFNSKINSPFRLNIDNISTICEDANGNLWMGNPFNGIDIFYWEKGKTVQLLHDPGNPKSLGKGAVQTIYKDSKLRVWVGTYFGGLQLYQPNTEDFISFIHQPNNPTSIASNDVRSITEDLNGNLWICTHGKGVDKFNPETGIFMNYNAVNNGLANDYTFDIDCDSTGNIWVASVWGLSVLRNGTDQFESFYHIEDDHSSISNNFIYTVHVDGMNRLWAGTTKGLNLYNSVSNNFIRYNKEFANINIVSLSSDNDDNIWAGTFSGISRLNPETGLVTNLSKNDGLISNNFVPRAAYNNGTNTLFWGTIDGLNYFNVDNIKLSITPPEVYITGLKIFNQEANVHNSNVLTRNILLSETIKLNHTHKVIEIFYSALNFNAPENNSYAYYLEGFEKTWNYVGNKRSATYTNLKPGQYTFKVKAANNEGVWNETGVTVKIVIKPPFWDTLGFKIIAFILLIALITGLVQIRERKLVKDKIKLEQQVRERTSKISEQNAELEKQKIELEKANDMKNHFFSILAHDLRGPVSSLVQLIDLMQIQKAETGNLGDNVISNASKTTRNVLNLLEDLLLWGKSQSGKIEIETSQINVKEIVDETIVFFTETANSKNIRLLSSIANEMCALADGSLIKVVLRNLVSNAIKFSFENSEVLISAKPNAKKITISVQDHGIGMNEKMVSDFESGVIKLSGKGTQGERGSGMGLSLCKELIAQNDGKLWIESKVGEGTTVFFELRQLKRNDEKSI